MAGDCALHRSWKDVLCVCGHGAGKHGSDDTQTGCLSVQLHAVDPGARFTPRDSGGIAAVRVIADGVCLCMLTREEVLHAALERTIAEVCEHQERGRTYRAAVRR